MQKRKTVIILSVFACALSVIVSVLCYRELKRPSYKPNQELYGPLYGKDYAGHVGDGKYRLSYFGSTVDLSVNYIHTEETGESWLSNEFVLESGYDYRFDYDRNLYYYSADGYAVIYAKNNLCKVYITDPPLEMVTGDNPKLLNRSPDNNYRIQKLEGEEFENIIYLDSYDDFTDAEKEQLDKLRKNVERTDKLFDAGLGYIEIAEKMCITFRVTMTL